MTHTLDFFKKNKAKITEFGHVLVDEYQDINALQFELLELLNPENLFVVGDPRQSIYGWRGSRIEYILDFDKENAKVVQLSKNYRSTKGIVDISNRSIKSMCLPDIVPYKEGDGVTMVQHSSEKNERDFLIQSIQSLETPRNEIMVLARTNKQIEELSKALDAVTIPHIKRTVEEKHDLSSDNQITLSTIHAIKGLEAEIVFLIGANSKYHPCRASEHPLLEALKVNDTYDSQEEELRLFYVALSRAKQHLIINYSGSRTQYLKNEKGPEVNLTGPRSLEQDFRDWRREKADALNIAPYQIFNDRTLLQLVQQKPISTEELTFIVGLGAYKIHRYGREIIDIVREN